MGVLTAPASDGRTNVGLVVGPRANLSLRAAGDSGDRRQDFDRRDRRVHGDLFFGGIQRLPTAADIPHL